ncbi:MAG: hypothetical protein WCA77_06195 [Thermoplasmata archaeon]
MNNPGPYYAPRGMGIRQSPPRVPWLPIIAATAFLGAALVILLVLLYPATFGVSPPSSRFGAFGGIFVLFFILIIGFFMVRVAFWGARGSRYRGRYGSGNAAGYGANRPVMVARMRYARGEITREQYDQIMEGLGRPPGPS